MLLNVYATYRRALEFLVSLNLLYLYKLTGLIRMYYSSLHSKGQVGDKPEETRV